MTPDGRLFVADYVSRSTWEYDAALNYVRDFLHPRVNQLSPFVSTTGVTYDPRTGTLWWTNVEEFGFEVLRTLLLEGSLAGVATGRRIQVLAPTGNPPAPTLVGGVFDPATVRFYFVDTRTQGNKLWAVDSVGVVVPGYPVSVARYPEAHLGDGLDVHGGEGSDPREVRAEVPVGLPGEGHWSRVVVTDPLGQDLGLETPIPPFPPGWDARLIGTALRSRLDPNGVMYGAFSGRDASDEFVDGLFAFRPVPLSPSWLALSAWMGAVEPAGSAALTLTFQAGDRAPGEYHSTLVVEDTTGTVLASVPLTLVVEDTTPGEPGPGLGGVTLTVSPNPSRGTATVMLALQRPAHVRLVAHDVLGRAVGELADESMGAGTHAMAFDSAALPAGIYVLRAVVQPTGAAARLLMHRLTVLD
jgi:hypothetical protein